MPVCMAHQQLQQQQKRWSLRGQLAELCHFPVDPPPSHLPSLASPAVCTFAGEL